MTDNTESNASDKQPISEVQSRRDFLKFGSMGTLGALLAGGALFGNSNSAIAQAVGGALQRRPSPILAHGGGNEVLHASEPITIVIVVYDGGTLLDFAGPSEVFHWMPNTKIRYASLDGGFVTLEYGVVYGKVERLADIEKADMILVPGGSNLTAPMGRGYQTHIRRLAESAKYVTSVCNGSLVLAATGILKGKRSACHWAFLNDLTQYGAIPIAERYVEDDNGRFMSGGGITAGIDFGLRVAAKLRGQKISEFAQLLMQYDPAPPFHSGTPETAPPEIIAMVDKILPDASKGLAKVPGVR